MNSSFLSASSSIKPMFDYLRKQQENRRFLRSLEITATFITITFFMYFAIRPTVITISSLKGEIESKKLLKTALRSKINDVIQAQDAYSQVQERYQIINTSLPDSPHFFDAAYQIQQTGLGSSLSIDTLTFNLAQPVSDAKKDPSLATYSVGLNLEGDFPPALKLASELLKNRRLVNIDSLNFTSEIAPDASPGASGSVNTNFSSTFYYWPDSNEKK